VELRHIQVVSMGRLALLFPGQGAQAVGMGRDFQETYPAAAQIMDTAQRILGWDLPALCFAGPQEELDKTAHSQPAMLTLSVAILKALEREMPDAVASVGCAAGLSLGEYSALVAADVLEFEEALRLVDKRSRLMAESCRERPGGMASVLGLDPEAVVALCAETGEEIVAANFNSPGQVVVSGSFAGLDRVEVLAKGKGAKRVVRLRVEGAFHSSFMASAGEKLAPELESTTFKTARCPVMANATADYVRTPSEVRAALAAQVTSPVLWQQSMQRLVADGFDTFIEVGAGNVLTGLMRRINSGVKAESVSSVESLQKLRSKM
jgi:[acyl-carrier-protein] S-malonyltransferase